MKENFVASLAEMSGGGTVHAREIVRRDPALAAVMSKLTHNSNGNSITSAQGASSETLTSSADIFHRQAFETARNINDTDTIFKMLPDTELPAQILVSCIISPDDMASGSLNYSGDTPNLPTDITAQMTNRLKDFFQTDYKINSMLPDIVMDVLFRKGSFAVAVLPESTVDDIIQNGARAYATEAYTELFDNNNQIRGIGILGSAEDDPQQEKITGMAHESYNPYHYKPATNVSNKILYKNDNSQVFETNIEVTDNYQVMQLSSLTNLLAKQNVKNILKNPFGKRGLATEAQKDQKNKMSDEKFKKLVYRPGDRTQRNVVYANIPGQLNRRSIGHPLVMRLPSEAVIPVYTPGNHKNQVGIFVLLENGHPLNMTDDNEFFRSLERYGGVTGNANQSGGNFSSALIQQAAAQYEGSNGRSYQDQQRLVELYTSVVEKDLLSRLKNGVYKQDMQLGASERVYRMMLARSLNNSRTQILYLPSELFTYIAVDYNSNGVGHSLMDQQRVLSSIRMALYMAEVHAELKNSIGRTKVNLKLDPLDPNPRQNIEMMISEIARTRSPTLPLGLSNPNDIADWIQRSSFEIGFEGNPKLPDVAVEFSETNTNYVKPDSDLSERIRKQSIMGFGLSPQSVDATYEAEFATSLIQNNILTSKRVKNYQDVLNPQLTDHLKKVVEATQPLMDEFRELINSNFKRVVEYCQLENDPEYIRIRETKEDESQFRSYIVDEAINDFLRSFKAELPTPNTATAQNHIKMIEEYDELLDKTLAYVISDDWFTDAEVGKISESASKMRATLKSVMMRNYMFKQGIVPELADLVEVNRDGEPKMKVLDIQQKHIEGLARAMVGYELNMKPVKDHLNETMDAADLDGTGGGDTTGSSSSNDSSSDSSRSDDDGGFGDDFGLDDTPQDAEPEAEPSGNPDEKEPTSEEPKSDTPPAE